MLSAESAASSRSGRPVARPTASACSMSATRSATGTGSGCLPCPNGSLPRQSCAVMPRATSIQARLASSVAAVSPSVTNCSTAAGSGLTRNAPGVEAISQATLRHSRARSAAGSGEPADRAMSSAWSHQATACSPW